MALEMPKTWDDPGRVTGQSIRSSRRVAALQGGQARGSWAVTSVTGRVPQLQAGRKGTQLAAEGSAGTGKDGTKPRVRSVQEINLPKHRARGRQP